MQNRPFYDLKYVRVLGASQIVHTPGEWTYDEKTCTIFCGEKPIAEVACAYGVYLTPEERANAVLLTRAPKLLALCKRSQELFTLFHDNPHGAILAHVHMLTDAIYQAQNNNETKPRVL